jgi:hypothetical protein
VKDQSVHAREHDRDHLDAEVDVSVRGGRECREQNRKTVERLLDQDGDSSTGGPGHLEDRWLVQEHSELPEIRLEPREERPERHSLAVRNRSALPITDTEDKLIARLAITGESSNPKAGYNRPAAIGTPSAL